MGSFYFCASTKTPCEIHFTWRRFICCLRKKSLAYFQFFKRIVNLRCHIQFTLSQQKCEKKQGKPRDPINLKTLRHFFPQSLAHFYNGWIAFRSVRFVWKIHKSINSSTEWKIKWCWRRTSAREKKALIRFHSRGYDGSIYICIMQVYKPTFLYGPIWSRLWNIWIRVQYDLKLINYLFNSLKLLEILRLR